ncbi:MAG: septation protein A [Tistrella sp.]|jgi:intracellular septation protein|uniref:Inner membrane-spanning protein YciB n=1 Tax=Tistrella mobilis TaxID=171437 RepID=A0A3B9IN53_9PROT|nr:septation protein A [Tistrella sp.]MAD39235.1 septation protein A [Tistrella sp.]MBA76252.1 septation protein A [Tistrella sp.]HAE49166.1 septation protein A [Tistrella mobilis]
MTDKPNDGVEARPTEQRPADAGTGLMRLALEAGPLVVFFVLNAKFGLMTGTAGWMAATAIALSISWVRERRVPILPLVSGVFVLGFGGLALIFDDELFIKIKPTVVNTLFGVILLGGLALGRPLLKPLVGWAFLLDHQGWLKITRNWGLFFLLLAVINEVVWRNFSTDFWVGFKLFGIMPLTLLFSISQVPLIQRHTLATGGDTGDQG